MQKVFWLIVPMIVVVAAFVYAEIKEDSADRQLLFVAKDPNVPLQLFDSPSDHAQVIGVIENPSGSFESSKLEKGFDRVNYGEQTAWVSHDALEAKEYSTYTASTIPTALKCYGEEPFWEASVTNGEIELNFHNEPQASYTENMVVASGDKMEIFTDDKKRAEITQTQCQSSMIDTHYNWRVVFETGNSDELKGCCMIQR